MWQRFHGYDTRSTGTKNKNKKWDYIKLESSTQQRELSAERKALIQYDHIEDEHYLMQWLAQYNEQDAADSFQNKYPIE